MKRVSIYIKLIVILIIFLLITFFVEGQGKTDLADKIITISSFVFGIILAFSIANRHSRLSIIREKLREQDAILEESYLLAKKLNKNVLNNLRKKIDEFLIIQIDYKLKDFSKETPKKLKELFVFIENIKPRTKAQENVASKLLDNFSDLLKINEEVSYQTDNQMASYEWISLIVLSGIIFFSLIFYFNTNTLISTIIIAVLCTTFTLLLLVLRDLDKLEWQENNWIWKPLSTLFTNLDLLPYFPKAVFTQNRLKLKNFMEFKKIRVATYPNFYPDFDGKKVKIVNLK
ncbi:hypothetical protein FJZ19_03520 [Candidatus Pacearchaeota archaeon]|nr:hypothetical protein [Candidatus Pacearchaeota archaeon]